MNRRAFTLVEMVIALSISVIMLASFGGLLVSVWMMSKEATDEMECALRACAVRQKLFHRLTDKDGVWIDAGGLSNATDIRCEVDGARAELVAAFAGGASWSVDLKNAEVTRYFGLDATKCKVSDYRQAAHAGAPSAPPALQYVHLAVPGHGKATYYDRMVVPIYGRAPSLAEFSETMGVESK